MFSNFFFQIVPVVR